jgi:hypothetical protein
VVVGFYRGGGAEGKRSHVSFPYMETRKLGRDSPRDFSIGRIGNVGPFPNPYGRRVGEQSGVLFQRPWR